MIVSLSVLLVLFGLRVKNGTGQRFSARTVGVMLIVAGAYFYPFGAIEFYDWTRETFGLTRAMNTVLHYAWTTAFLAIGFFLAGRKPAGVP